MSSGITIRNDGATVTVEVDGLRVCAELTQDTVALNNVELQKKWQEYECKQNYIDLRKLEKEIRGKTLVHQLLMLRTWFNRKPGLIRLANAVGCALERVRAKQEA